MRIGLAFVLATIMAVITLIFHITSGSSLWIMLLRTSVTWVGFVALILFLDYSLKQVFGDTDSDNGAFEQRKRLDLVSRPEEDSIFYK